MFNLYLYLYLYYTTGTVPLSLCNISNLDNLFFDGNVGITCYASCLSSVAIKDYTGTICDNNPTLSPTAIITSSPSFTPSMIPSEIPSEPPTKPPSVIPTTIPSEIPTVIPTTIPSQLPSVSPTATPSFIPSATPTTIPPTAIPTITPSFIPTAAPTVITQDNALCGFIAATNIGSVSGYSMWTCTVNGFTSTNPCSSPMWTGVSSCDNGYVNGFKHCSMI